MNNRELQRVAKRCPELSDIFLGVFPSDALTIDIFPNERWDAYALIVNLDPIGSPGSHWIALYLPGYLNGTAEYFDSYGQQPILPNFLSLLKTYKRYIYSNITLQSPLSTVCGQYCLFYLCLRAKGIRYDQILRYFQEHDTHYNDVLVNEYVRQIFKIHLKIYDFPFIGKQIAHSLY